MWVDWEPTRERAVMMEERERPPQTRKGPTSGTSRKTELASPQHSHMRVNGETSSKS